MTGPDSSCSGFMHLAAGLSVGLTGLAAGYAIGVVGDMVTLFVIYPSALPPADYSRVYDHTCNNREFSWGWS